MKGHKVVKDFKYKGRRCVIIEIDRSNTAPKGFENSIGFKPYCNGYVELKKSEILENYDDYPIKCEEITYQGNLKFPKGLDASDGKQYIGFDSAHSWNDEEPESKTVVYIEKTCKKLVNELINTQKD